MVIEVATNGPIFWKWPYISEMALYFGNGPMWSCVSA